MKKVISLMLVTVLLIAVSTTVFAAGVLDDENLTPISPDDYNDAQNNNVVNNNTSLPQTGIEDYNVGILLAICIGSAIFAYKKVNDYRNI